MLTFTVLNLSYSRPGYDGGLSPWNITTPCSQTCGNGQQTRERTCTNPRPAGHGRDCSGLGPKTEVATCINDPCEGKVVRIEKHSAACRSLTQRYAMLRNEIQSRAGISNSIYLGAAGVRVWVRLGRIRFFRKKCSDKNIPMF